MGRVPKLTGMNQFTLETVAARPIRKMRHAIGTGRDNHMPTRDVPLVGVDDPTTAGGAIDANGLETEADREAELSGVIFEIGHVLIPRWKGAVAFGDRLSRL